VSIREGHLVDGVPEHTSPAARLRRRARTTLLGYLSLTKPRVIELLLVTTIPAMLLADRGSVNPLLILNTLVGGLLAAAGANALNCVADADIDKVMKRTERRPLARDTVPRSHALIFGLALSVGSFFWLWWTTNMLSAHLAGATIAFYVLVYTLLLKRRTSQNVVWGGAAGCMPVMIGWSAVTGTIQWPALVMFAIIFFWTPPHTWALAMRYKEDYRAAGVPMLPAVATERQVTKQILIYTWLTVLATLSLALATGWLYASVALVAGEAAAVVPAVEQLPGHRVLRAGHRLGAGPADAAEPLAQTSVAGTSTVITDAPSSESFDSPLPVSRPKFGTYTRVPSGVTATPPGLFPTGMFAMTVSVSSIGLVLVCHVDARSVAAANISGVCLCFSAVLTLVSHELSLPAE
jgi:heme o synthase